jgi:hypothetical protein
LIQATFALPTDDTDLNPTGMLVRCANGLTFCGTGDTAYAKSHSALIPNDVDVCAIFSNGGCHARTVPEAAEIVSSFSRAPWLHVTVT